MKRGVRMIEFVEPSQELKNRESDLNRKLTEVYPQMGPVRLHQTKGGEIAVQMTITVVPGQKRLFDEVFRFVMKILGPLRGRKPGENRIQVKYRVPEELHRRLQDAALRAHLSASDLVTKLLRERLKRAA